MVTGEMLVEEEVTSQAKDVRIFFLRRNKKTIQKEEGFLIPQQSKM
jgi:hypothetical protein